MNAIGLCFLVAFFSASAYAEGEELFFNDTNAVECRKEFKLDDDDMVEVLTGHYPDREEVKCFVKCWYEKSGYVNERGEVLEEAIRTSLVSSKYSEAFTEQLEECKDMKVDTCENAYEFDRCLMKAVEI